LNISDTRDALKSGILVDPQPTRQNDLHARRSMPEIKLQRSFNNGEMFKIDKKRYMCISQDAVVIKAFKTRKDISNLLWDYLNEFMPFGDCNFKIEKCNFNILYKIANGGN
jgi:hypothetical protein